MKIIKRNTGEYVTFKNRRLFMMKIGGSVFYDFYEISTVMNDAIEKYKDAELEPYVLTPLDQTLLRRSPKHWWDIPKYHVKGFDRMVNSSMFEKEMKDEMYERWLRKDIELINVINNCEDCLYSVIMDENEG